MSLNRKIYFLLFVCLSAMLAATLLYALPHFKKLYTSSLIESQASQTAALAGQLNKNLAQAATELAAMSVNPVLQNWNPGGSLPELTILKRTPQGIINELVFLNIAGEAVKTAGDTRTGNFKLYSRPPGAGQKGGLAAPAVIVNSDGKKFPALICPVVNTKGQAMGWLAGIVGQDTVGTGPAAADTLLWIIDIDDNIMTLSPAAKGGPEIAEKDRETILRLIGSSGSRSLLTKTGGRDLALAAAQMDVFDWLIVSIQDRSRAIALLQKESMNVSLSLAVLWLLLLAAGVYAADRLIRPVVCFVNKVKDRFTGDEPGGLDKLSTRIESLYGNVNIMDSVPVGIMVVDRDGIIRFFNREAGEITEQSPSGLIGKPMNQFFPSNYYNYTMDVIASGNNQIGLRNIIKVGSFFKELLFNINTLYNQDIISGAVATFQDVTPQRKLVEVNAAYDLARDLATQKDLNTTVQVIAKAATELVEIDYSAVLLTDPKGNLTIRSANRIPDEVVEKYNTTPFNLNDPAIKTLYRKKLPLLHGDVRNKNDISPHLLMPGIQSFYSFPILHDGEIIGLLNLYGKIRNKLTRDDIHLINSMSDQVNTAVSNYHSFQNLKTMTRTDGLTGLFNKKHFIETLESEVNRSLENNCPLSLAMLDLDHFKVVNDTHGHPAGDNILKGLAAVISNTVKESQIVCRCGGEEFAVIMPETSGEQAFRIMERVRSIVENWVFTLDGGIKINITISTGIATCPADATTAGELVAQSDAALYRAKGEGRNRVIAR